MTGVSGSPHPFQKPERQGQRQFIPHLSRPPLSYYISDDPVPIILARDPPIPSTSILLYKGRTSRDLCQNQAATVPQHAVSHRFRGPLISSQRLPAENFRTSRKSAGNAPHSLAQPDFAVCVSVPAPLRLKGSRLKPALPLCVTSLPWPPSESQCPFWILLWTA
jgi:hypothetical protein